MLDIMPHIQGQEDRYAYNDRTYLYLIAGKTTII